MYVSDANTIGKAQTVLVFGDGHGAVAITTNLIAQGIAVRRRSRPRFGGAALFDDEFQRHAEHVIVPVVDSIGDLLEAPKVRYEISVSNIGAASGSDTRIRISGFSADVPLFLALLSARLRIPVSAGIASTGHIASPDGDIRWVRHLPAKLSAAAQDAGVRVFLCPGTSEDSSVRRLSPQDEAKGKAALADAQDVLRVVEVANVDELVKHAFQEAEIVMGSLASGFYDLQSRRASTVSAVQRAASYLRTGNQGRFWNSMEAAMLAVRYERAREALELFINYFTARCSYPSRFGLRLRQLLLSLPPKTRQSLIKRHLITVADCIRLSQFAGKTDHQDVHILYRVAEMAEGDTSVDCSARPSERLRSGVGELVDALFAEMSSESIARAVGLRIDSARAAYVLESVTVSEHGEFLDGVVAFYIHLLRHLGTIDGPSDPETLGPEALGVLRAAFRNEGGESAACREAMDGVRGGMRYVLDRVTDEYKRRKAQEHIEFALERAVGGMAWDAKMAFVSAMFRRIHQELPPGIEIDTPERFAGAIKSIAQAWTESMERLNTVVKSM